MNRIYSFKKFNESGKPGWKSDSSTGGSTREFVEEVKKQADQINLDIDSEETQKAIFSDLIEQFDKNMNNKNFKPELNLARIASLASNPAKSNNSRPTSSPISSPRKLQESVGTHSLLHSVISRCIDLCKKFENIEYVENNYTSADSTESKKSIDSAIQFLKKGGLNLVKGVVKILEYLLKASAWILNLFDRAIVWILRNIFGLSHSSTSYYSRTIVFAVIFLGIIFFLVGTAGFILSSISISSMISLLFFNSWEKGSGNFYRGFCEIVKNMFKFRKISKKASKQVITIIEFIDRMDKIKKIKLPFEVRRFLEEKDRELNMLKPEKDYYENEYLSSHFEDLLNSENISEEFKTIPLLGKLFNGDKLNLKEDKKEFEEWINHIVSTTEINVSYQNLQSSYTDEMRELQAILSHK
jgi:hypothetical protein